MGFGLDSWEGEGREGEDGCRDESMVLFCLGLIGLGHTSTFVPNPGFFFQVFFCFVSFYFYGEIEVDEVGYLPTYPPTHLPT